MLATFITIVNYDHRSFIVQATGAPLTEGPNPGSNKANKREPKSYFGRDFNFKLDCFVMYVIEQHIQAHPSQELKLGPGFVLLAEVCPCPTSLVSICVILH
jgi:hypothetical protein